MAASAGLANPNPGGTERWHLEPPSDAHEDPLLDDFLQALTAFLQGGAGRDDAAEPAHLRTVRTVFQLGVACARQGRVQIPPDHRSTPRRHLSAPVTGPLSDSPILPRTAGGHGNVGDIRCGSVQSIDACRYPGTGPAGSAQRSSTR